MSLSPRPEKTSINLRDKNIEDEIEKLEAQIFKELLEDYHPKAGLNVRRDTNNRIIDLEPEIREFETEEFSTNKKEKNQINKSERMKQESYSERSTNREDEEASIGEFQIGSKLTSKTEKPVFGKMNETSIIVLGQSGQLQN